MYVKLSIRSFAGRTHAVRRRSERLTLKPSLPLNLSMPSLLLRSALIASLARVASNRCPALAEVLAVEKDIRMQVTE